MATAAEAKQFIEANYNLEVLGDGNFKIIFSGDSGRTQLVFVDINDINVQVYSPFATVEDVTPKQALAANAEYGIGMQLLGNYYVVKHYMFLADLDADEILEGLRLVAGIADDLEKELVGTDNL